LAGIRSSFLKAVLESVKVMVFSPGVPVVGLPSPLED
jgi:hypothetical protein